MNGNGHDDDVNSVAFFNDGKCVVSGSSDKTVRIWDAETGKQMREFKGHLGAVNSVAVSPNGVSVASGGEDDPIRFWDVLTGKPVSELNGHLGGVNSVAFNQNGSKLVSGGEDDYVRIWKLETGRQETSLAMHDWPVYSVSFSSKDKYGTRVVSGSGDDTVVIWDATKFQRRLFHEPDMSISSVLLSADGTIVSASCYTALCTWDVKTGELLWKVDGAHRGYKVNSLCLSTNGIHLASAGDDGAVRIWDARTGQPIGQALYGHKGPVNSVAFSQDGMRLVSGGRDTTIMIWKLVDCRKLWKQFECTQNIPKWAHQILTTLHHIRKRDGRRLISGPLIVKIVEYYVTCLYYPQVRIGTNRKLDGWIEEEDA